MPSISGFLRDHIWVRKSSDAAFAAGVEAWKKFQETHEQRYLREAVQNHQAALEIRVSGHPGRGESLCCIAVARWAQCQIGAVTKKDSSEVISYCDEALRLLPTMDKTRDRALVHNTLGLVYFSSFCLEKIIPDNFVVASTNLDKAIGNHRSAVELTPAGDDLNCPKFLSDLSQALIERGGKADSMEAITFLRELVGLRTSHHQLLFSLDTLARAYRCHYYYSKDIGDLVETIGLLRRVLDLTTGEVSVQVQVNLLLRLAKALCILCKIEPSRRDDLNEAVRHCLQALKQSDKSNNVHVDILVTLANVLSVRYTQSNPKNITDLDQVIQYYREAIHSGSNEGPDPVLWGSLAFATYTRWRDFGEADGVTVEGAITCYRTALAACPTGNPLHLKIQKILDKICMIQSKTLREKGILTKGTQLHENADSHHSDDDNDAYRVYATESGSRQEKRGRRKGRKLGEKGDLAKGTQLYENVDSHCSDGDEDIAYSTGLASGQEKRDRRKGRQKNRRSPSRLIVSTTMIRTNDTTSDETDKSTDVSDQEGFW